LRHHSQRLRVNFVDTDLSGRIHYTAAMRYFEAAEHALMRAVTITLDEPRTLLPRVHVEADFKAMLAWEDEIDCTVRVAHVGRTSITFVFEVTRCADAVIAVTGKIVAVAVDEVGAPQELSAALRAALEEDIEAGTP
jgi:acyl-CoA thioester hydrolase